MSKFYSNDSEESTNHQIEKLISKIQILEAELKYEYDDNKKRRLKTLKRRLLSKQRFQGNDR